MSLSSFLAPILLLLSGDSGDAAATGRAELGREKEAAPPFSLVAEGFRADAVNQVRIEQRTTIRITPRPAPVRSDLLFSLPSSAVGPRFAERKIGKCLPVAGIAGVQVQPGNKLMLFLRDRRMVSASLERACSARDFYSGFYVAPNADGQLCVDRDTLLSRSGSNCKLSRIRQIVEIDD